MGFIWLPTELFVTCACWQRNHINHVKVDFSSIL